MRFLNNISFEKQKIVLNQIPTLFKFIDKKQTEELQEFILNIYQHMFQYCINRSKKIEELAVRKSGCNIRYIANPSYKIIELALESDPDAIRYIYRSVPEKFQLKAVEFNVENLQYLKNPTEKTILTTIYQDPFVIRYVSNQTNQMKELAIKREGSAIKYVKNPSLELQKLAIDQDSRNFYQIFHSSPAKEITDYHDQVEKREQEEAFKQLEKSGKPFYSDKKGRTVKVFDLPTSKS